MKKQIQICFHMYKYVVDIDNRGFTVEWACATGIVYKFQKVNLD